jgi:exosortase
MVIVSLALLVVGRLGVELFLTRASLLGFIGGSIVFLFGWRHLRTLAFPLALLLLTIPIPTIVVTRLTLSLQLFASRVAEFVLVALGIPVLREGNVLELPNATLQVAEACSGIRSLTALVTLALVVARFSDTRWPVRAVILASAIPIAVLVNAMRVAASAIAAHWYGLVAVQGFVHELMGWLMFLIAFALMTACARAVGGRVPRRRAVAP